MSLSTLWPQFMIGGQPRECHNSHASITRDMTAFKFSNILHGWLSGIVFGCCPYLSKGVPARFRRAGRCLMIWLKNSQYRRFYVNLHMSVQFPPALHRSPNLLFSTSTSCRGLPISTTSPLSMTTTLSKSMIMSNRWLTAIMV